MCVGSLIDSSELGVRQACLKDNEELLLFASGWLGVDRADVEIMVGQAFQDSSENARTF